MREHLTDNVCCDVRFLQHLIQVLAQNLHQILFHFSVNVGSEACTLLVVGITTVAGQ